tara:strand:+ start:17398 stop:18924 length:1527 start_codon:yes stop_codon:yes gene_type:complete
MHFSKLATSLALALGLVTASGVATAQPKGSVQAELSAIKAELASLQEVAASAPTMAQAVQELSSKLARLETEIDAKMRAAESMPDAILAIHALQEQVVALQTDLEYLRTSIANIEQPAAVSSGGGGGAVYDDGMKLTTGDGRYEMTIGGYLQPRYQMDLPEDFSSVDRAGFQLRRARIGLRGKVGSDRLRYQTLVDLTSSGTPLLDYFMDMKYREELTVRVGQTRLPYTRSFLVEPHQRAFFELSATQDAQRYDRDLGVWALGNVLDGKLRYHAGVANGAGANTANTNIDMVVSARVEGVVLGAYIPPSAGDVEDSDELRLTVGGAFVHDLVQMPSTIAGIDVENRDVDGNGVIDNVRAVSSAIDAQMRYKGWDVALEATWRHERWGSILRHDDNSSLASAVDASSDGVRNYLGFTAEASYFVLPKRVLLGARVSHGRIPLLGLGGQRLEDAPPAQRALQVDGLVQLYRDGYRRVGFMYSMLNYNAKDGLDPADDISHSFMLEAQLVL